MYVGMKLKEFKKEWMERFASDISKSDIEKYVVSTGNYIWHIFSWKLVDSKDYLVGRKARQAFNKADKTDAWYIIPFNKNVAAKTSSFENITAEKLEEEVEIYVVAKDLSWTYIKTHENDLCGPYFYCKKS